MKQLLLLLTFCATISAYAQDPFVPMFDSINVWHYTDNYMPVIKQTPNNDTRSEDCQYPHYSFHDFISQYTDGDTIIDSTNYLKLMELQYVNGPTCIYGYLREDTANRKVYFLPNNDTTERLLYDFSIEVGDSMSIDFEFEEQYSYYKSGMYHLDSITTLTITVGERRVFHLNNHLPGYHHTLTWIEGVGCITDFVYTHTPNSQFYGGMFQGECFKSPHDSHLFVTCYAHDEPIYIDSCAMNYAMGNSCFAFENSCRYYIICTDISEIEALSNLRLLPNPTQDNLTVSLEVREHSNFSLSILDVNGQMVAEPLQLQNLSIGVHSNTFSVAHLAAGIYLLRCSNESSAVYRKFVKQ